jgi:hypothetical protein
MTKQTAVEWLMEQMSLGDRMHLAENGVDFEKAKAMEDEQIKTAYKQDRRVINLFDERELNMKAMDYLDKVKGRL